jgi:hypothetical protein
MTTTHTAAPPKWEAVKSEWPGAWNVRPVHPDGAGYGAFAFNLTEPEARAIAIAPALLATLQKASALLHELRAHDLTDPDSESTMAEIEAALAGQAIPPSGETETVLSTFTAFCQEADGSGTIWIQAVQAADLESAKAVAIAECAAAWEFEPAQVHCLGIAAGDVEILHWEDF